MVLETAFTQVFTKVFAFIFAKDTERECNKSPEVYYVIMSAVVRGEIVNLRVTVMTRSNHVWSVRCNNLFIFNSSIIATGFLIT